MKNERLPFRLPDVDGEIVQSSDARFRGKVLLIDLWGSWCPPCLSEIPTLVDLQERYRDAGLVVIGISFERAREPVKRRAQMRATSYRHEINYLLLDGGTVNDVAEALPTIQQVRALPVEVLVGRTGRVISVRNGTGYSKKWARNLEAELRKHLGLEEPRETAPDEP